MKENLGRIDFDDDSDMYVKRGGIDVNERDEECGTPLI